VVILIMIPLFLKFRQFQQDNVEEISYGRLRSLVEEGAVKKAIILRGGDTVETIKGEYELPDASGVKKSVKYSTKVVWSDTMEKYLNDHNVPLEFQPANQFWLNLVLSAAPFVLVVVVLYLFFARQIKMAGKGAMSFGKSRARMLSRDKNKVTFKDVAGMQEAKEEVEEIIQFLKDPKKFQRLGGRIPKGVLMVGPPGTGKTLLAKAIAGEADVPFFSISGSDFVEMFVGVGASRVRDMFEQGKKSAPCLIFIDEIDAVGRSRFSGIGGGHDEREQTLNALLVEMDGFDTQEGVIIIAATNRPDVLDAALLRPGRFDRQIVIDMPDVGGREEILKVHARAVKLSKDVDFNVIARGTAGFSGADLANLINEAAVTAVRDDRATLTAADFDSARDRVLLGTRHSSPLAPAELTTVAVHEAGHALVATLSPHADPVSRVTVLGAGQALGLTETLPADDRRLYGERYLADTLAVRLGGRAAERLVCGEASTGAADDLASATALATQMVREFGLSETIGPVSYSGPPAGHPGFGAARGYSEATQWLVDQEVAALLTQAETRARDLLTSHREALNQLTAALLEQETVTGDQVRAIAQAPTPAALPARPPASLPAGPDASLPPGPLASLPSGTPASSSRP
jgi:cell division protease FtsH